MQSFPAGGRDWVAGELREESVGHRALCPPCTTTEHPGVGTLGPGEPDRLGWDRSSAQF